MKKSDLEQLIVGLSKSKIKSDFQTIFHEINMDPLSQGTVGAAFAQSTANKNNILKIGIIGFFAGLAPDLDILIQSSTDPVLFLEYHRQFSHSLFLFPLAL